MASGITSIAPIRPVFNCLIILCPTLTATTSSVSFDGLKTFTMTRNNTLTLPSLKEIRNQCTIRVLLLSARLGYDETYDKESCKNSIIYNIKDRLRLA